MLEIVKAGGWLMVPIVVASIVAVAIFFERLWTLQTKRVAPASLTTEIWELVRQNQLDSRQIARVAQSSPLGQVLAAGLAHRHSPREVIRESIEDTGRHAVHELERYLGPLGTIAAISPLLGLLGTVSGMIRAFSALAGDVAASKPLLLAQGVSEALVCTAAGLLVGIMAFGAYALFRTRAGRLTADLESATTQFFAMFTMTYAPSRAPARREMRDPMMLEEDI